MFLTTPFIEQAITPTTRLVNFPDFRANRNIFLVEGFVHAKADLSVTRREKIDAVKPSLDYRPIGSAQLELVARFQAHTVSHIKRHTWSKMQGSVLKLNVSSTTTS